MIYITNCKNHAFNIRNGDVADMKKIPFMYKQLWDISRK